MCAESLICWARTERRMRRNKYEYQLLRSYDIADWRREKGTREVDRKEVRTIRHVVQDLL
jgi:hypothetical protein